MSRECEAARYNNAFEIMTRSELAFLPEVFLVFKADRLLFLKTKARWGKTVFKNELFLERLRLKPQKWQVSFLLCRLVSNEASLQ